MTEENKKTITTPKTEVKETSEEAKKQEKKPEQKNNSTQISEKKNKDKFGGKKVFNKKRGSRRNNRPESEFEQVVIDIARVTRVMAGGKRMRFRACVAVGNKKGKIGLGLAKGVDVTIAINKAVNQAKKNMINVQLANKTIPHEIKQKYGQHLSSDAYRIEVSARTVVNKNIEHQYLICDETEKLNILMQFLKSEQKNRGLIFCKTKIATQKLAKQLKAKNVAADAIHGDLLQKERDKVMRAFKNESLRILVATDLAARGIDVEGLSFVVHYQLPDKDEYYTHRSGRTARAGKKGISICLVTTSEMKQIRYFEKVLGIGFRQIRRVR